MRVKPRPSGPWCRRRYKKGIRGKVEKDASYHQHQHQPMRREEEGSHLCPHIPVEIMGAHQVVHYLWDL